MTATPICTEEHCSNVALYTYTCDGIQYAVCGDHYTTVLQRLTALGKIGTLHPDPVVFHRVWITDTTEWQLRVRELEHELAHYKTLPLELEQARQAVLELRGHVGVLERELETARRDLQGSLDRIRHYEAAEAVQDLETNPPPAAE